MQEPTYPPALAGRRAHRELVTESLAQSQDGVASRRQLRALGITRDDVRHEVAAGRWRCLGRQTVAVCTDLGASATWWRAVWEVHGAARLDGVSALLAHGLTGWEEHLVHVSVPHGTRLEKVEDVRVHRLRYQPDVRPGAPDRTSPEWAALHAASWASSDRAATTLVAMVVQQRLTTGERLREVAAGAAPIRRIAVIRQVLADVCAGAQAISEIDFTRLCRSHGIPQPSRQSVRRGPSGRIYLDAEWEGTGVIVEIDGFQHTQGLAMVDDALRDNHLAIRGARVIRIPVLGLRTAPAAFMAQVREAIERAA